MRLLNVETFDTEEFFGKPIPPYTILSHTWGEDKDEISFSDVKAGRIKDPRARPEKLVGCCEQTKKDGLRYTWIDTCCIDKASAVELGEAINSMFKWYAKASLCYAYLSDVPPDDRVQDSGSAFISSRWFTRGWTLQELLAPGELHFYSSAWSYLGTRSELSTTVQTITGIARPFLLGIASLHEASVAQRMSWAARRVTKRKEDIAYCLLGIFGVMMPMIYGEGDQSFIRLQEEIIKHAEDDSILAWGWNCGNTPRARSENDPATKPATSILATSPTDFAGCAHIVSRPHSYISLDISGGRLRLQIPLVNQFGITRGLLNCGPDNDTNKFVGIPLARNASSSLPNEKSQVGPSRQHWFYIEDPSQINLELVDVEPRARWQKARSIITTENPSPGGPTQRTLAKFRHRDQDSYDFIVLLEFGMPESNMEAKCHAMICSRDTTLAELAVALEDMEPSVFGETAAGNGLVQIRVHVTQGPIVGQSMFTVKLTLCPTPQVTIDLTEELKWLRLQKQVTTILQEEARMTKIEKTFRQVEEERNTEMEQTFQRLRDVEKRLRELTQEKEELTDKLVKSAKVADKMDRDKAEIQATRNELRDEMLGIKQDMGSISHSLVIIRAESPEYGQEMLLWAASEGRSSLVNQLLTEFRVDIESRDTNGSTPLYLAAYNGHYPVVQLLLEQGARIDSTNKRGMSPMDVARHRRFLGVAALLQENWAKCQAGGKAEQPLRYIATAPSLPPKIIAENFSGADFTPLTKQLTILSENRVTPITPEEKRNVWRDQFFGRR
ncbi:HET-domain-containing protein [Thozetella sp. PMI_491]|nr:HET-domain-containing protein [Thozetella sp. PMI_491]